MRRYERERYHEAMNLFRDAFRAIGYLDGSVPLLMSQRMDFDEGMHCFTCTLVLTETDGCSSALILFYIGQAYRPRNHVLKQDIPNATIILPKFHKVGQLQHRQGNLNEAMNTYSRNIGRTSLLDSMMQCSNYFELIN